MSREISFRKPTVSSAQEQPQAVLKRREVLRFAKNVTALGGTSAAFLLAPNEAYAAPNDKTPPNSYVPLAEKGSPSGVATLDVNSKLFATQVPDLSGIYAGHAELVYNVKNLGLKGDGSPEDDIAFATAVAAIPNPPNAFGNVKQRLHFPAGRYQLGVSLTFADRLTISGDGPYQTILYRKSAASGDFITLNGANSVIRDLTLDGNRTSGTSGDLLVLNAGYTSAQNLTIANSGGNGITIGKAGAAIVHRLNDILIRFSRGYGVQIKEQSGSTDGQWCNVDIGQSGWSGVRVQTGSQMLTNVHVWLSGLESTTDKHGIWLSSTATQLIACQSESNLGNGVHITPSGSNSQMIVGCKLWGNIGAGIYAFASHRMVVSGNQIYRNGITNAGVTSGSYSGIFNDGGTEWSVSGNCIWDDNATLPASSTGGTYSYPGRTGANQTQAYAIYEGVNSDYNAYSGNEMRCERTRTGKSHVNVGPHNQWSGNQLGANATVPVVVAAEAITLPSDLDLITVIGTAAVRDIALGCLGRRVTLIFTDAAPGGLLDGASGTLRLSGAFTPSQNDTITLICGASCWHEVGRSGDT